MEVPTYPRIPSSKGTNENECLGPVQSYLGPQTGCQKIVKAMNVVRNEAKPPSTQRSSRIIHFGLPILG